MFVLAAIPVLLAVLRSAAAQTPPGFPIAVSEFLSVTYENTTLQPAGKQLSRPETRMPPSILPPASLPPTSQSILFMIDLDVPKRDNTTREMSLHWFVPSIPPPSPPGSALLIPIPPPGTPYRQPSPPPNDFAHRYVFLLYAQPAGFVIPQSYANINPARSREDRVGFDIRRFVKEAKLGKVLAASWVEVRNGTGAGTGWPPLRTTAPPEAKSGGGKIGVKGWVVGVLVGVWGVGMGI
ncbi:PEBP-like protein [Trichodelitschia bisporula]|uniref:PEBP-like protein n=1 Tax=Trichodelitschia bisporula TaxID=703511 RepID=A0A6G1HYW7_9PEZI|nr:PEBP-like protein [Trichodelitschia bisporula]